MKVFAAGLGLALLLTGCAGGGDDPPAVNTPSESTSLDTPDNVSIYLDLLRNEYPQLNNTEDEDLLSLGTQTCTTLDSGVNYDQMIDFLVERGADPAFTGFSSGAAIVAFCPEHLDQINQ